jgi:hypothetical protein
MGWLIKMSENRVDPTVAGLFLVTFITLVFGFLGFELYSNLDFGLEATAGPLAAIVGMMILVLMVSAIRCGNAFAAALYGFVALSLFLPVMGFGEAPMLFYIAAILYIVFAVVAFLVGAPKLLMFILIFVGVLYLFVGVFSSAANSDVIPLLFGICGVLAGVLSLYLAFALSTQKLPVF